jgi:hypothetical protein
MSFTQDARYWGQSTRTLKNLSSPNRIGPFHRLAADHRDLVCGLNRAYLEGLLEGMERDELTATLEPEPGRCCVVIRHRRSPGSS